MAPMSGYKSYALLLRQDIQNTSLVTNERLLHRSQPVTVIVHKTESKFNIKVNSFIA